MKENSIEEDIKILEELRIANENCIKNAKNKDNPFVTIWEKQNRALEHILSDYKRVLKENERYQKSDYETICLENKELKEINERLESENQEFLYKYGNVLKENEQLKIIKSLIQTLELNQIQEDKYILITKRDFLSGSYKSLLDDYIPIQKIKNKIEELEKRKQEYEEENIIDEDYFFDINGYNSAIFVLQELLESEE